MNEHNIIKDGEVQQQLLALGMFVCTFTWYLSSILCIQSLQLIFKQHLILFKVILCASEHICSIVRYGVRSFK